MIDEITEYFITFCYASKLSERTISDYKTHLSKFKKLIPTSRPGDYRSGILSYLGDEKIKSPYTYNLRFAYLHRFFSWAIEEGFIDPPHPLRGLKKKKVFNKIVLLTSEDIECLLAKIASRGRTFVAERDKVMLLMSIDGGYRPSELVSILPSDIDFRSNLVTIRASRCEDQSCKDNPHFFWSRQCCSQISFIS